MNNKKSIESAATMLSYYEIEMITKNPYRIVIRKLEDLIIIPNPVYDYFIN